MSTGMSFGLFIPQGWRHDLVGIAPKDQWRTMRDLAEWVDRDAVGFRSTWVNMP